MESEIPSEAIFALKHGQNTTERFVPDLLAAIRETLEKHGIVYQGTRVAMKRLGEIENRPHCGGWSLLIDAKDIKGFDHIEFCITKTGWGRMIAPPAEELQE